MLGISENFCDNESSCIVLSARIKLYSIQFCSIFILDGAI